MVIGINARWILRSIQLVMASSGGMAKADFRFREIAHLATKSHREDGASDCVTIRSDLGQAAPKTSFRSL